MLLERGRNCYVHVWILRVLSHLRIQVVVSVVYGYPRFPRLVFTRAPTFPTNLYDGRPLLFTGTKNPVQVPAFSGSTASGTDPTTPGHVMVRTTPWQSVRAEHMSHTSFSVTALACAPVPDVKSPVKMHAFVAAPVAGSHVRELPVQSSVASLMLSGSCSKYGMYRAVLCVTCHAARVTVAMRRMPHAMPKPRMTRCAEAQGLEICLPPMSLCGIPLLQTQLMEETGSMLFEMLRVPAGLAGVTGVMVAGGMLNNRIHTATIKSTSEACSTFAKAKYIHRHANLSRAVASLWEFCTNSDLRDAYRCMVRRLNRMAKGQALGSASRMAEVFEDVGSSLDIWIQLLGSGTICIADEGEATRTQDVEILRANPQLMTCVRVGVRHLPLGKHEKFWVLNICTWMLDAIESTYKFQLKTMRDAADAHIMEWRRATQKK